MATCSSSVDQGCLCAVCLAEELGGDTPTKEQAAVIEADPRQPLLVVAGAGSGKTTTMADRVVWLCANQHVRPDQILGVTFTNKAASGLKRKVTEQLLKLAASGIVSPEQMVAGDTARLSSQHSMESRGQALADLLAPTVSTYNSYANTLIKQYGTLVGIEPHADLGGEARLWQLARSIVDRLCSPEAGGQEGPTVDVAALLEADRTPGTVTADLMKLSDQCAEHGQDPSEVARWLEDLIDQRRQNHGEPPASPAELPRILRNFAYRRQVALLAAEFDQRRRQEGLLSYADQLTGAVKVAQHVDRARAEQRARYKVVLLDEFQDTSYVQSLLFSTLFGDGHSVTAVGDPNQSIYGFRGASAGQLFAFRQRFPTASGASPGVEYLTTAWRNGPAILKAANALLSYFGQQETLAQPWHTATADEVAKLSGPQAQKRLRPSPKRERDDPGTVTVSWYPTSQEEADGAVESIRHAYRRVAERRQRQATKQGKPAKRPTVAVLARAHRQLDAIAEAFDRQPERPGLPRLVYERNGLAGLLSTPEVHEVLCYLNVLADPSRSDVLIRILSGDKYQIGPKDLYALGRHAAAMGRRFSSGNELEEQHTLMDAIHDVLPDPEGMQGGAPAKDCGISQEGLQRLEELWGALSALRKWAAQGISALVERIIEQTGLRAELVAKQGGSSSATHQLSAFIHEVADFEAANPQASLQDFLEWTQTAADQEKGLEPAETERDPEAVQLMTMHAAKGLEWDIVATIGWRAPDFPDQTAKEPWTGSGGWLPWPLRGDAENLPRWGTAAGGEAWLEQNHALPWDQWCCQLNGKPAKAKDDWMPEPYLDQLPVFRAEEDRRLAYVAVTRAADELIVSGSLFSGTGKGTRKDTRGPKLKPSVFLEELAGTVDQKTAIQEAHENITLTQNPASVYATQADWPHDPLEGVTAVRVADPVQAAELGVPAEQHVRLSGAGRRQAVEKAARAIAEAPAAGSLAPDSEEAAAWVQEAGLILAQQAGRKEQDEQTQFPEHLSASNLVALEENRQLTLRRLRRPVPMEPKEAFRAGTQTHEWIEDQLGSRQQPAFDPEDIDDDGALEVFAAQQTREKFLNSVWAHRNAFALELNFATPVGETVIRGQIDAVYGYDSARQEWLALDDRDRYDRMPVAERNELMQRMDWHLVDWKTGVPPAEPKVWEARKIQLAIYRLAFHRMYGVPLERITASFHYVDQGEAGETKTIPHQQLRTVQELEQVLADARIQFTQQT